jgi:hypothetical protein
MGAETVPSTIRSAEANTEIEKSHDRSRTGKNDG